MKDGGPAFPGTKYTDDNGHVMIQFVDGQKITPVISGEHSGMSLRDYFAAAAMQGMIAYGNHGSLIERDGADSAYRVADKMLEARDRW